MGLTQPADSAGEKTGTALPLLPLSRLKRGARAVVVDLSKLSAHERRKLMALGLMPGADVHLIQRFPSYVVAVGYTQLALDKETARLVIVRPA